MPTSRKTSKRFRRTDLTSLPPHHRPGGGFRNPWPDAAPRGFGDFLRWVLIERMTKPRPTQPSPDVFAVTDPTFVTPRAGEGSATVTWIGHSSLLIQIGGRNVLTDPVWSDVVSPVPFAGPRRWVPPAVAFEDLPDIDVILVSHNHYDHCDVPTIRRLAARFPTIHWLVPLGLAKLLGRCGVANVTELDWWNVAEAAGLRVTCTPAQHFSARGLFDRNKTLWCSWVLSHGESRIYFGADSALHPEYARIGEECGPFEVVILPIGAYEPRWFMRPVHMNPEDAVQAYSALANGNRPAFIPIHWGTFKLTDEPMDEPPRRLRAAWAESRADPAQLRIPRHGETIRIW